MPTLEWPGSGTEPVPSTANVQSSSHYIQGAHFSSSWSVSSMRVGSCGSSFLMTFVALVTMPQSLLYLV